MIRFITNLCCLVLGFMLGVYTDSAKASEYYGTPIYYSKYFADTYPCVMGKVELNYCGNSKFPETAVVGYKEIDGVSSSRVKLLVEVVCDPTGCSSNYGEPYGRTNQPGTSYWLVPVGYYLDVVDGKVSAFRHGTGQLAKTYPIRDVLDVPKFDDTPKGLQQKDTIVRYNVYCNVADECSYLGRRLVASELRQYIPRVMTYNCQGWFCYNPDDSIAGINPKS